MKKNRNKTLNSKKIEFLIANEKLVEPYDIVDIGYYLTRSTMDKSKKATLATFQRMKERYKYAYPVTEVLNKYITIERNPILYSFEVEENSSNRWVFTNYDLLNYEKLELNPIWFNTDELLVCLEDMRGNGLSSSDYIFLLKNIQNYNLEKENWSISNKVLSQLEMRYIFLDSNYSPYKIQGYIDEFNTESISKIKCTDGLFRYEKNRLKRYFEYKNLISEYKSTPKELIKKHERLEVFLSHLQKPEYTYPQLTVYNKQYKKIFNLFRRQYSKWQTQKIMKEYLHITHKMIEPLEDSPIEFNDAYNLGNDGFGYHGSTIKTSMDDDEIVQEIRDETWWEEEQELNEYNDNYDPWEHREVEKCSECGSNKLVDEDCSNCSEVVTCDNCGSYKYNNEECKFCEDHEEYLEDMEQQINNQLKEYQLELIEYIKKFYSVDYTQYFKEHNIAKYVDYSIGIDPILENYYNNLKTKSFDNIEDAVNSFLNCKNYYGCPF